MVVQGINNRIRYVDRKYDPYNISTEDFLRIYLKMLQLQDPTKPMDVKDMVQMNYQLQQIRFTTNLDKTLNGILQNQHLNFVTQAAFLIGKEVILRADSITNPSNHYVLISPQDYTNVTVTITERQTGQVVNQFTTNLHQGINEIDTSNLEAGEYIVSVSRNGQTLNNILLGVRERIAYVSLVNNQPVLGSENGEYLLANVVYISS